MKRCIRFPLMRALVIALAVAPLSTAAAVAQNAATKPVATISVASVDKLLGNVTYLTKAVGAEDQGALATLMVAPMLEGVDKTRPAGALVSTDGENFQPLVFIPVTDLAGLLSSLKEQIGEPEDEGNGVLRLALPTPVYIKEQTGWAFVAQTADAFANVPANPAAALGNLPNEYDFAARVNVNNIPEMYRAIAVAQLQAGIQQGLARQPGEDAAQHELRKSLLENNARQISRMVNEVQDVTVGWKVDASARNTFIDFSMTAVAGSEFAAQFAQFQNTTSRFAGFVVPDAALTLNTASTIAPADVEQAATAINSIRRIAIAELDKDQDLQDEATRTVVKDLLNSLMDVLVDTIRTGKSDLGATLELNPGSVNFVMGAYVADGTAVEEILKKVVALGEQDANVPPVRFNASTHGSVRFHTVAIPVPQDEQQARQILGDHLEVAVGIDRDAVYLGIGRSAVAKLTESIDRSRAGAAGRVAPLRLNVSLKPIIQFAASVDENPALRAAVGQLSQITGNDQISLVVNPQPNGCSYRIQLDEGALQVFGALTRAEVALFDER